MKYPIYQVDAFSDVLFHGNPAAVVPLNSWLPDEVMQSIAAENNLSETAFFIPGEDRYELRWFTPSVEVDLCGHATLAAAHVLFRHLNFIESEIRFSSRSGMLRVMKEGDWITLDFPSDVAQKIEISETMQKALRRMPLEVYKGKLDFLAVLSSETEVLQAEPDLKAMAELGQRGVIISAKGNEVDFVSRYFAPNAGIDEDPVTGSAHCVLIPYWSSVLGKHELTARQVSKRGGSLKCKLQDARVLMSGKAVTYLSGEIFVL